jgi:secondary thiamine-phosphate synthase enzyme
MTMTRHINVKSARRIEMLDITAEVAAIAAETGIDEGLCHVYVPHTTAAVTINEGADPSVRRDILATLNRLVPETGDYTHAERNSDAHIKATLVGSSVSIPIEAGKLALGSWQSVYLCEFDGPRHRRVHVNFIRGGEGGHGH